MFTEDNYIMWLNAVEGFGLKKKLKLMEYFKSAENIWNAAKTELNESKELSEDNIECLLKSKKDDKLDKMVNELYSKNIRYISRNNIEYPELLKEIPDPPLGLYIIGKMPDENIPKVSMVGSRRCTEYGATSCYKLSKDLGKKGLVVVSGMAQGIDTMAHKGVLDGGGETIAVLGTGVDICYPASNRELMKKIIDNGCAISEFPLGTEPTAYTFPIRNRIISGMSMATVVIEAGKRSGTLITVNQALDQGRNVFALPGNITSQLSEGTNNLIKEGAFPVTCAEDITEVMGIENEVEKNKIEEKIKIILAPEEKLVYDGIRLEPITVDELMEITKLNIQTLQYILTMLELKGYIQKLAGQKYIRGL